MPPADERPQRRRPNRLVRALTGVVAAAAGLGLAHLVAALLIPASSPLLAVGSVVIDAAPTPLKEFAVRTFGNADKPVLLGGIAVVLVVLTGLLGLLAYRRLRLAVGGVVLLGVVAGAAAVVRIPEVLAAVPALVAVLVGSTLLVLISRRLAGPDVGGEAADDGVSGSSSTAPLAGLIMRAGRVLPARRSVLLGGPAALAAVGIAGGTALGSLRSSDAAVGRDQALPEPADPAEPLPDGVQPDVEGITPFVTDLRDFYRVDIALSVPRIDAATWSLPIEGMVDEPLTLTYADILAMPMIERHITLSCVSNPVGGPYVSTARWLGVPLVDLLDRVGVQDGAEQLFARSADGFSCSIPLDVATDGRDAMLVVGMNGQQLPFERGFPARLLVPGLFGFVSAAKWLEGLKVTTYADDVAYWTEREWATDAPVLTQARIDVPGPLEAVPAGDVTIAGMAWAQHRGIEAVEVRIDGGEWQQAELATDGGADLWRSWTYTWTGSSPGRHDVQVRATDATGETQPEERTEPFPDGARGWQSKAFVVQG